jgi:hypothetical protein
VTCCVVNLVKAGIVFCSDSRTNSGAGNTGRADQIVVKWRRVVRLQINTHLLIYSSVGEENSKLPGPAARPQVTARAPLRISTVKPNQTMPGYD